MARARTSQSPTSKGSGSSTGTDRGRRPSRRLPARSEGVETTLKAKTEERREEKSEGLSLAQFEEALKAILQVKRKPEKKKPGPK